MTASNNTRRVAVLAALWMVAAIVFPRAAAAQSETPQPAPAELTNKVYLPSVRFEDPSLLGRTYPGYTNSFYITSISNSKMFSLGCEIGTRDLNAPGTQNSVAILALGQPWSENGVDGVYIFSSGAPPVPYPQIALYVQQFMSGYWSCSNTDTTSQVTVVVGVNNYGPYGYKGYSETTIADSARNHGGLMAQAIDSIAKWLVSTGYGRQISVVAGLDAEFAWNSPVVTRAYIDGFLSKNAGGYRMFNFGTCDACPTTTSFSDFYYRNPNYDWWSRGWYPDDAWYVTFGARSTWPLPEIYIDTGKNAKQWKNLSLYAYQAHGSKMTFIGSLTQYQACLQNPGEAACDIADNTPQAGWTQLHTELNNDFRTAQPALPYATDILWTSKPRP